MEKQLKTDKVYDHDQFFTKKEIAEECLSYLDLSSFDTIIEPSAGCGSFSSLLPKDKTTSIEIDPLICKKSWINISFFDFNIESGNILIIGNPPFGTQNNLSVDFFNHAAKFADTIAFIIPKTWKKSSVQNRLDEHFILRKSIDLPQDCFFGEKPTNVKCCFQIWQRSNRKRKKQISIIKHSDWEFLSYTKTEDDLIPPKNADFIILAYGSNSGQVTKDLYRWRPKSVHFIKANIDPTLLIERFESLNFNVANNSARQSSLCKGDLVKLYAKKYG